MQSSDVVRLCPWTLFTIVISGVGWGDGERKSICEVPKRTIAFRVHEEISFIRGGIIWP